MKTLITRIKRLALALCFVTPLVSWAATEMTNPVTGETETYVNTYTGGSDGTGTEWNSVDNWDTSKTPFISGDSGDYSPSLVSGKTATTTTQLEGWTPRIGAYNGAVVTFSGGINKIQNDSAKVWLTADETSTITIASFAGNQLENANAPFVQSSANASGITWTAGITSSSSSTLPFWYCLKGSGTVVYGGNLTIANPQIIKNADITLSGNATPSVESKTLVTFGSGTTATFTAAADIKVYDGSTLKETVGVTSVRSAGTAIVDTSSTLTTSDAVGSCEIVQCTDGIVLYYVDGNPDDIVAKTYTPSISVNLCDGSNPLTTAADVGFGDFAVPGTSWNNILSSGGNSSVFTTPLSTIYGTDSTGAQTLIPGASAAVSGTRGSWGCSSLVSASDVRNGYADDNSTYPTPTVTISGIPYYQYKVVVYTATDAANVSFGYVTVNGTDYTYVEEDGVKTLSAGTSAWGASGASNNAEALAEGVNVLVSPVTSGSTATVVGHNSGGRGCIAAVQIVEVPKTAEDGELVINVSGDTTYTVSEDVTYTTVYVTGVGTLAFSGEGAITTTTLNVGNGVTMSLGSGITTTTVTGSGTIVYNGAVPATGLGWTDSAKWQGTLWVKNTTFTGVLPNTMANANSTLRLSGVVGYFNASGNKQICDGTLELENDSYSFAFSVSDGWSTGGITVFAKLKGSGTLGVQSKDIAQRYVFKDASEFTGTINLANRPLRVILGDGETLSPDEGTITIVSGAMATVASGATWTANKNGFRVEGTLNVNGTLASSATGTAVKGSGTVVFTGRAPTPTGDTWWKNSAWTGTVQMKDVTNLVGGTNWTGTNFLPNNYGNTGSVLELYNCSGWLPNNSNYQCTVPLKVTGTLSINNGISGSKFVISSLSGSGAIYTDSNTATVTIQVLEAENFTGYVQLNSKRVVFGNTLPSEYTVGNIYVGEGFSFTVPNSDIAWYGTGGITLAGELKAAALSNFGGGTTITTTDNGVFTLTSTGNGAEGETDTNYARIKGTGSLKYEGTGWRALTTNNLSTAVTLVNEQAGDILLSRALTYTVGSLSGSKNFQGNYDSGSRYLNVIQSKDTEWSGKVVDDASSRFAGLKLDASSTGTLTLSGTASQNVALEVNGGAVNLTGTWKGATTVAGTIGGTGTLTGNLTFSEGATFKAFAADDADGLFVSGTVTCPAEGTVTVDVSAIEPETDVALLKAEDLDASKFVLADGTPEGYSLDVVDGVLTLKLPVPTTVEITIPSVDNATVSVTADGVVVDIADGKVTVDIGANVVVTYTAAEGYQLTGDAISFTASASTTTVDVSNISVAAIVANVTSADGQTTTPYTSAASAIAAADDGETVTLLENTVTLAEILTISKSITIVSGNASGTTITGSGLSVYPQLAAANLTIGANVTFGSQLRVTSCDATITYPTGSTPSYRPPSGYQSRTTDNANDTSTITFYQQVYVYTAGTNVTLYDDDGNQIGASCPVAAGSTFEFTVTPADGCTLVSVTAGGVELTPSEGKYSIEIGTANVSLYAIAGAAVVTGGDSDVYCSSLQAAVDAATSGATVTLLANVTLDARVEPNLGANTTLTIDLGGYTLTREGTGGNGSVFDVKSGTVTIKNGTIDCTQDDTAIVKDGVYAITARSGSAVTLEDLTITVDSQAGACVYPFNGATVTIKSGTYKNETADEYQYKTGWTGMAVNQDNVTTQLLFIEGGKFWQVNPEEGDDSGKVTNFLAAGRIATLVDGYWTVSEGAWAAQVGSNKYTSLAAALGAATDGDTVTLLADATLPQPKYTLSKAITLNLNGKTLSAEGDTAKTATLFEVVGGKTLTVVGTTAGSTVYGRINVGNASQEGNLTIQGGYYEVGEQTVVHVNGKRTNSSVSITGATIVSTADNGIQLNGAGTHTITDTSITGATAVYLKAGSLAISGTTTLAATGAKGAVTTNNNGSDATGDALVIDNCTPPYQQITGVTIASTVTLTSANASAILVYARSGCTRQTKFVPAAVKDNITEAVATEADVFDDYVDTVPVDAGAQTDPVDTQAEAEADAAKVVPSVPAAVAAKLSDDQQTAYKALFEAKVVEVTVGESTKYAVEVALKADVVSEIQTAVDAEAEDLATAAVAAAADATNGGKATVATTPGLYYVVEAGTEPNGTAPASCTLAESGSTTLTIPNKGAKGFYKIRVSVTPVVVQE